ncbi:MAG TPA: hypothetical protein VLR49_06330 [Ferruginibacter sp.]|nr:hypothetical protein [Ferruginibacter sp.]
MKTFLFLIIWVILSTPAKSQELSADKLIGMLSLTIPKTEGQLLLKKYFFSGTEVSGDTTIRIYQYKPISNSPGKQKDSAGRRIMIASLKGTSTLTYQTNSEAEFKTLIESLKKDGFHCEYEKDSGIKPASYLYQYEDYTAEACTKKQEGTDWHSITFFKKNFLPANNLQTAEELLEFTSHEYLEYYFGKKNVKKDLYYFAENDIVNCSVLFINTKRQVIFVWKDGLNKRRISNLLFGGQNNLKRQQSYEMVIAENAWMLKSGLRIGMPLVQLCTLNENNISFCGGKAPNPGLVLPESTGKIDFSAADVILGCSNCTDEKFLASRQMNSDMAMDDGRILFVLSIVLYPTNNGIFE